MKKISVPQYAKGFKCIGGACEDSCCIGWEVDIDYKTYESYKQVQNKQMKQLFQKFIYPNSTPNDVNIDYALVKLTQDKKCPFLNADHLCMIQKHLGESYLSNVCTLYPRIINQVNGKMELSLSPSCPEAMRLLLRSPEAMKETIVPLELTDPILTYQVNTRAKRFKGSPVENMESIRKHIFEILTSSSKPFEIRVLSIGAFIEGKGFEIPSLNEEADMRQKSLKFANELIAFYAPYDSQSYTAYCKKTKYSTENGLKVYNQFMTNNPHILENYFANYMRRGLFPFTEVDSIFDAYLLLFSRFLIIRTQLLGMASRENSLSVETVGAYLQSFSKVFEHHRTFAHKTLEMLHEKNLSSMEALSTLMID